METNVKELEGCLREVEIKISDKELQPHFNNAYQKAQPHVDIKGFRKGKVPINMVKKVYGESIENETLQEISTEYFNKFVEEGKLKVVGQPKLVNIEKTLDLGAKFIVRYDVFPEFELTDYKNIVIDEPVHVVTDEEIDAHIDTLLTNNGDISNAEVIEDNQHIVGLRFTQLDDDGNPASEDEPQVSQVYLADKSVIPELRDAVMNQKTGYTFKFEPHKYDEHAPDAVFEAEIASISKLTPKVFDDEFVKEYTQGKFETAADYRDEINFKIQADWDARSRQEMENNIVTALVDAHEFPVPEDIVENVSIAMIENMSRQYPDAPKPDDALIEQLKPGLRPVAERTVRWEFIRSRIMEVESIDVEDHDVEEIVESEVQRTGGNKGAIKSQLMGNRQFSEQILSKKVMDLLLDFAETNEVKFKEDEPHDHDHDDCDHEDCDHDHDHEEEPKED